MFSKKGQAWGTDLIIASVVFIGGLLVFYFYSLNISDDGSDTLQKLQYSGELVAEDLFSEGYPKNWEIEDVQRIGIVTDSRINQTKLESFYNLSTYEYEKTKSLFNLNYEYYISFQNNVSIYGQSVEGIGLKPQNSNNLIKITRVMVYNDKPTSVEVEIWN